MSMSKCSSLLGFALLAAGLAACSSPGPWMKSGVSPEDTARDLRYCRAAAQSTARDRLRVDSDQMLDRQLSGGPTGSPISGYDQVKREQLGSDERRITEREIDSCMTARGYGRASS